MATRSPLAPAAFPALGTLAGVRFAAANSGLKADGRLDTLAVELAPGSSIAGVFTTSRTASRPVRWCREALAGSGGRGRVIVANSGNSNAFTGKAGDATVAATVAAAAQQFGCAENEVVIASTGVIGVPFPPDTIAKVLPALGEAMSDGPWEDAARAIMTTDTYAKGAVRTAKIGGATVTLQGIAKGSGMIAPDMATMFGFVFTDASLPPDVLQALLADCNGRTFNCITVDSDTSTSDTVLLCATGKGPAHPQIARAGDPQLRGFKKALEAVMQDLARQIVRDGEGATKEIEITVTGAAGNRAARRVGMAIANSPLIKTMVAGCDPNWGRLVMAVGKSGERAERDLIRIAIDGRPVTENGMVVPGYDEAAARRHLEERHVRFSVDLGLGRGKATVWTCDLTHGYIAINADYRS